ncbi:class I SAM-dependent methyltransferase [bacterium]|nr:class I SAM-dependent methyltransferase [bacterium]
MTLPDFDLDWHLWFERWEAMQNCYIPQRLYRFALMLELPGLPREDKLWILDLGCGPGSLAFLALRRHANGLIVAVDFDPVLVAIGQQVAKGTTDRIQFLLADIREGGWWKGYEEVFDLVLSATALHWLNAEHLAETYGRIYGALKPGGWFMNSDHIASDNPRTQALYRKILQEKHQKAFRKTGADDWNGFWEDLGRELNRLDLLALRNEAAFWEGTEDGQPKRFHIGQLERCGFEEVEIHWQELGEAVIGARKPSVR